MNHLTKKTKYSLGFNIPKQKPESRHEPNDDLKNLMSVMTFLTGALFGSVSGLIYSYRDIGMISNNELYVKSCLVATFAGIGMYLVNRLGRNS